MASRSAFTCFIYCLSAVTLPSSRLLSLPRPVQLRIVMSVGKWSGVSPVLQRHLSPQVATPIPGSL